MDSYQRLSTGALGTCRGAARVAQFCKCFLCRQLQKSRQGTAPRTRIRRQPARKRRSGATLAAELRSASVYDTHMHHLPRPSGSDPSSRGIFTAFMVLNCGAGLVRCLRRRKDGDVSIRAPDGQPVSSGDSRPVRRKPATGRKCRPGVGVRVRPRASGDDQGPRSQSRRAKAPCRDHATERSSIRCPRRIGW